MAAEPETFKDVEIRELSRMNNSDLGVPRFKLHTNQGDFQTEIDAAINFGIQNLTKPDDAENFVIGNPGRTVNLVGRGREGIFRIQKLD